MILLLLRVIVRLALVRLGRCRREQAQRSYAYPHAELAQLVRRNGYDVQQHFVETPDGYVLGLYRILARKPPPFRPTSPHASPVILQHGLLDSAATWVVNPPTDSLGFILVDRGYDVWLANSRGSTFSRNHTGFSVDSTHFWDFTLDEMATYDLPATVEYVRQYTESENVSLVAHSQGGAVSLAALASGALPPEHLSILVTLAPAVYLKYISSIPLQFLSNIHADTLFKLLGQKEFLPSRQDASDLFGEFCSLAPHRCASMLTAICGFNEQNIDLDRLPIYLAYAPSGTSVKNMAHWAQRVRAAETGDGDGYSFRKYDYGTVCEVAGVRVSCNQRMYGRADPPVYDLSKISRRVQVAVIYGLEDKLADPVDTRRVIDALGASVIFEKGLLGYEHIDFTWSQHAAHDVYPDILRLLEAPDLSVS